MKKGIHGTILVVDDSEETVELIRRNLESGGYSIYTASNVQTAIRSLEARAFDLVITDLKMPDGNGLEIVRHASENYKNLGILVITGFPSIQGAVESIRIGAEEYLVKPFTDQELFDSVSRVLARLPKEKTKQATPVVPDFGIIGESGKMVNVFKAVAKARPINATVLISGESGTGKELVARAVHYGGQSSNAPFVPVNCGGIPDALLESELFGYVKGAFTGATETRAGFFQTADGGTIFLDEIGNTSLAMQAKLLRVLQEKEFYMVGSKKQQKVNVRIVAATNVNLMQLVKSGKFREDLFYRLNIIAIDLPALREREQDVDLLTDFFISKYNHELKKTVRLSVKARQAFHRYPWPGNVRELQNLLHRLVIFAEGDMIDVPDLPEPFRFSAMRTKGSNRTLADVEREHIIQSLSINKNNISRTADMLGIDRKTLREKIKRYRISGEQE